MKLSLLFILLFCRVAMAQVKIHQLPTKTISMTGKEFFVIDDAEKNINYKISLLDLKNFILASQRTAPLTIKDAPFIQENEIKNKDAIPKYPLYKVFKHGTENGIYSVDTLICRGDGQEWKKNKID